MELDEQQRAVAIDRAVRAGDLVAVLEAVGNRAMPLAIGPLLTYAVYHAPLALVRELLDGGYDPNEPSHDGFPPLIAAITCAAEHPGSPARSDVNDLIRLLLEVGAHPDVRGINDWTPLHAAIGYRGLDAIPILLAAGADPTLRTRIDHYETAEEMAAAAGLTEVVALLRAWTVNGSP